MKKLIYFFVLTFFLFGHAQKNNQDNEEEYESTSVIKLNQLVTDFSFKNLSGEKVNFSTHKNKIVLINFFATWCGPCVSEMPFIQKDIWEKYKDNPDFMILSFGRGHTDKEVNDFIKKENYSFPIYADPDKSVYNFFAMQYIPRNYLLDRDGKVVYSSVGFSKDEFEVLKDKINHLLKV
jgi:thiol-disulfide isomerase/thioredoxin